MPGAVNWSAALRHRGRSSPGSGCRCGCCGGPGNRWTRTIRCLSMLRPWRVRLPVSSIPIMAAGCTPPASGKPARSSMTWPTCPSPGGPRGRRCCASASGCGETRWTGCRPLARTANRWRLSLPAKPCSSRSSGPNWCPIHGSRRSLPIKFDWSPRPCRKNRCAPAGR